MRRLFLAICSIPALTLTLALTPAVAGETLPEPKKALPEVNAVLASVNGVPISLVEILKETRDAEYRAAAVYSGERLTEEIRNIRRKAVDERVDKLLVLEEYRKDPTPIPSQAIEEELDKIAERMGVRSRSEFIRRLRNSGTTVDELRKELEEYLIFNMMIYSRIRIESNITPREVYDYYQARRAEFIRPEQVGLAMILLPLADPEMDKKSAAVAKQLAAAPDSFAELAKRYSDGPNAENGGDLGRIERKRLRAEFAAAMPEQETGRVYGPVRTAEGTVFLRILSHTPEEEGDFRTLGPEIRDRIDREQREGIREKYLLNLRSEAIIRYFF